MPARAMPRPNRSTLQVFSKSSDYFSKIKGMARKKRLFVSACIRLIPDKLLTPLTREAITWSELHADGREDEKTRKRLLRLSEIADRTEDRGNPDYILNEMLTQLLRRQTNEAVYAAADAATAPIKLTRNPSPTFRKRHNRNAETDKQLKLFDDIFGNLFLCVEMDPRWQTSTVLDLARTIYEERAFERMPILADALMDAGCDSETLINHCREPGPHVRGCWVVDLLTGRE